MPAPTDTFSRLALTLSDVDECGTRTDRRYELRTTAAGGAEVWMSTAVGCGGTSCVSDARYLGRLSSRQVVELLADLERCGVYEAGTVDIDPLVASPGDSLVSMSLRRGEQRRRLLHDAPLSASVVALVVRTVRCAIDRAQERALAWAG